MKTANLDKVKALHKELTTLLQLSDPNQKDFVSKKPYSKAIYAAKSDQDLKQKVYWFLRKAAGIDDLSNAHWMRMLLEGRNIIYETVFGNRFMDWATEFEFPKVMARKYFMGESYETGLLLLQAPLKSLMERLKTREEKTGQASAPKKEVKAALNEGKANFVHKEILNTMDFGVAMTHIQKGKKTEDLLAAFKKTINNKNKGVCFTTDAKGCTSTVNAVGRALDKYQ